MRWQLSALSLLLTTASAADPVSPLVQHVAAHPLGDVAVSFPLASYSQPRAERRVGVFDSGIGGLTVLEAMLTADHFDNQNLQPRADGRADFCAESFCYLGDQANMPYGNYSAAGRVDLLRELILRDAVFLLQQEVKAIVIACNTATAYGLEDIRQALQSWQISLPVVGVVEAGARAVVEALPRQQQQSCSIGILATVGTCSCEAYPKAISAAAGLAGLSIPTFTQQACVGLAGAIEGDPAFISQSGQPPTGPVLPLDAALAEVYGFHPSGLVQGRPSSVENHVRYEVASLLEQHRQKPGAAPLGIIVLGCTHFPLVKEEIATALERLRHYRAADGSQPYASVLSAQVQLINPAEHTAKELFRQLARVRLQSPATAPTGHSFHLSVPNAQWPGVVLTAAGTLSADYKHSRPLADYARQDTRVVQMKPALLPEPTCRMLQQLMPQTWQALNAAAEVGDTR